MTDRWERTKLIYGEEALKHIAQCRIAIFGIGGVGSYAAEAILRSGVGEIDVYDFDFYDYSNFNRQLYATELTVGTPKVEAFRNRACLINPDAVIHTFQEKLTPETVQNLDLTRYDYVLDAIDDIKAKIALIEATVQSGVKIISAMGAGNKVRPDLLEITTIDKTSVCPLARIIRTEARKRRLPKFHVVYSKEQPVLPIENGNTSHPSKKIVGSTPFVPATMGLLMASKVINDISNKIENTSHR